MRVCHAVCTCLRRFTTRAHLWKVDSRVGEAGKGRRGSCEEEREKKRKKTNRRRGPMDGIIRLPREDPAGGCFRQSFLPVDFPPGCDDEEIRKKMLIDTLISFTERALTHSLCDEPTGRVRIHRPSLVQKNKKGCIRGDCAPCCCISSTTCVHGSLGRTSFR